jgi:hypothetical protein
MVIWKFKNNWVYLIKDQLREYMSLVDLNEMESESMD